MSGKTRGCFRPPHEARTALLMWLFHAVTYTEVVVVAELDSYAVRFRWYAGRICVVLYKTVAASEKRGEVGCFVSTNALRRYFKLPDSSLLPELW